MKTRNFADVIRHKLANNPKLAEAVAAVSFNLDLIANLVATRQDQNLSQKALAEKLQCTQSAISKIENGDDLNVSDLYAYAKALGYKVVVSFVKE